MKQQLLTLTILLTATLLCGAQDKTTAAEQEIKQLIAAQDQALVKGDVATIKKLLTEDFTLVTPNGAVTTKEQFLNQLESRRMVYEEHHTEDIKLRVFADTAVARCALQMKAPFNGQSRSVQMRVTIVFVKVKDQWQMFTLHSSAIPPPRPAQPPATLPAPIKPPSEL